MFHPNCDPQNELEIFLQRDWNQDDCCYEIAFDAREGRYLRAKRDIFQGELILEESPLIRLPSEVDNCCLGCFSPKVQAKCHKCHFQIFCSSSCPQKSLHEAECSYLAENDVKNLDYQLILLLR